MTKVSSATLGEGGTSIKTNKVQHKEEGQKEWS